MLDKKTVLRACEWWIPSIRYSGKIMYYRRRMGFPKEDQCLYFHSEAFILIRNGKVKGLFIHKAVQYLKRNQ